MENINPLENSNWVCMILIFFIVYLLSQLVEANPSNDSSSNQNYELNRSTSTLIIICIAVLFSMSMVSFFIHHFFCNQNHRVIITTTEISAINGGFRWNGLDPSVIKTFPILLYSEVKNIKIGKETMECAICLMEFEDSETLRFIPNCHHVFHPQCIDEWLASHITCPVCRANLTEDQRHMSWDSSPETPELSQSESSEPFSNSLYNELQNDFAFPVADEIRVCSAKWSRTTMLGKFLRSHSTGHSLVEPRESAERYTLRLPEDVRRQILTANAKISVWNLRIAN